MSVAEDGRIFRSISECVHSAEFPRPNLTVPLVNRCDGRALHVALTSGPRRGIVKTGSRVRAQIVFTFEYLKDQKRGFVTVLMNPSMESRIRQRIEYASDELVRLIQQDGTVRTVYRLNESDGLIVEET